MTTGGQYRILWLVATLLMLGTEYCGSQTSLLKCLAMAASDITGGGGSMEDVHPTPAFLHEYHPSPGGGNASSNGNGGTLYLPTGQLQDAKCNVEEIEHANDSQLYSILHDLVQTTFFRNFVVDLDHGCPLSAKRSLPGTDGATGTSVASSIPKTKPSTDESNIKNSGEHASSTSATTTLTTTTTSSSSSSTSGSSSIMSSPAAGMGFVTNHDSSHDDDGGSTCGGGLPDFFSSEHEGKAACDIELSDADDTVASALLSMSPPDSEKQKEGSLPLSNLQESSTGTEDVPGIADTDTEADVSSDDDDDDFECETSDELEDEPLCEIKESDFADYNSNMSEMALRPLTDFLTSALKSIWERVGWESESQRRTFAWSTPSDPVVGVTSSDGGAGASSNTANAAVEDCDETNPDNLLNDQNFWMDMCSHIQLGEGKKVVNLVLNPERNTGYNGTHIWKAIYDENCLALDGNSSSPMCYEERVLYRLLSGMQTSTSLSIAKNYYPPSKRKGRVNWEPNPQYFMEKFQNHPEYIRNLHFSYVVLLRALRKAKRILYNYDISTGDLVDDESASILLRRLLDSHILKSCVNVFEAFDESLMFKEAAALENSLQSEGVRSLQQNFKGVFHNISHILDCVQCQQCKLHGKMTMLGYGTALKILFLPESQLIRNSHALQRNEVVAFINTIAKFSESLKEVRELTHMYWASNGHLIDTSSSGSTIDTSAATQQQELPSSPSEHMGSLSATESISSTMDAALRAISTLNRAGMIDDVREAELVQLALAGHEGLLALAKHYSSDLTKFLKFSQALNIDNKAIDSSSLSNAVVPLPPDAIVVGGGLAGLAATLHILDRGGHVVLIEKEHSLGGNSAKASSGINGCCLDHEVAWNGDSLESFFNDTVKSAGSSAQYPLIETLTSNSARAIRWLSDRAKVDLSLLAQLGGHSHKRTHRPNNGMVGAEIIFAMQREVKKYIKKGQLTLHMDTRVIKLLYEEEETDDEPGTLMKKVVGVETQSTKAKNNGEESLVLSAPHVILATGGFASDRSTGSYLDQYRPELMKMPATAGDFSTGDGIKLATELGAGVVDMDKVQIHPTGWIDPSDPTNPTKILAAELMRGVGGVLINSDGKRFCNELGTRAYVADRMLQHNPHYKETGQWDAQSESPILNLLLSESAAADGKKHVDLYVHKGLLTKLEGIDAVAKRMNVDVEVLKDTLEEYKLAASVGADAWGKTQFRGLPSDDMTTETFYLGQVTPVLHYCMGGLTIDPQGNVLAPSSNNENDDQATTTIIHGLHAAGEVSGGVHGVNRLGGNSLLECTVFGTIVGESIPIQDRTTLTTTTANSLPLQQQGKTFNQQQSSRERVISPDELAEHNTPEDCWVALHGKVYDMTDFAEEHPPGAQSIYDLAGKDGTEAFSAVHNVGMLEDEFEDVVMGIYSESA